MYVHIYIYIFKHDRVQDVLSNWRTAAEGGERGKLTLLKMATDVSLPATCEPVVERDDDRISSAKCVIEGQISFFYTQTTLSLPHLPTLPQLTAESSKLE